MPLPRRAPVPVTGPEPSAPDSKPRRATVSRRTTALAIALLGLAVGAGPAVSEENGYLQLSNLLEYQIGRDPTDVVEEDERSKLFNQFILDYTRGGLRLGLRLESFRDSESQQFGAPDYDELTQKYVEWSSPDFRLRVGNGYVILGRGLLLRAFELPGVIRDANFPNSRYAESRDLDGVIVEGRRGRLSLTTLSGRPVSNPNLPYGLEDQFLERRTGTVSGGRIGVNVGRGLKLGGAYLRADDVAVAGTEEQGAMDLEIRFGRLLPVLADSGLDLRLYGEYAGRGWQPLSDGLRTKDGFPHAVYTATELTYGQWGLSFETKRYHQFNLLANDPPSVVPQFSYKLLNRATHVLLANDETGHQLSIQGGLPHGWITQAEWSYAINRAKSGGIFQDAKRYDLFFLGLESPPTSAWRLILFGAAGQDETEGITGRHLLGGRIEHARSGGWGAGLDLEFQQEGRRIETLLLQERQRFDTVFVSLGISRAGIGTIALQGEWSNDPLEKDDPLTAERETAPRSWFGIAANLQVDANHEAALFAGKRRGGTACTSGTCYEVPDFAGVEARITSRF